MDVKKVSSFNSISHRAIYSLKLMYPDSSPTESKKLHALMELMIDRLYANPQLLNLPDSKDEAYQSWQANNMNPGLDKIYQSVFKTIYEFYKFLYISALHGELQGNCLSISSAALKENKASYKPQYKNLLNEINIDVIKEKIEVKLAAETEILQDLILLAKKTPVNPNPWTPYALANFACCLFTDNFDYLIERTDQVNHLNGLLIELQKSCLEKGYDQLVKSRMGATNFDFSISFKNGIGGFHIGYNPRRYEQFSYGTINGIGEKAMLEDFENLDHDLQKHFISICKTCNNCGVCEKGGKNKKFTVSVGYDGKGYALCPSFPRHGWETIDHELIDILFKYHDAQEVYGADWKK